MKFKPNNRPSKIGHRLESRPPEGINAALKQHATAADEWTFTAHAAQFHQWAERFNQEFELDLPTPALRFDFISARKLGTYRYGRNGFGLLAEITMNARHLDRPLAEQLATLLHELIHCWQDRFGTPSKNNHHNRQFRDKLGLYGIICDERGRHTRVAPGRFTELLRRHHVDIACFESSEPAPTRARQVHGSPKMRKYRCLCCTVRCATNLNGHCDDCGEKFLEAPPNW